MEAPVTETPASEAPGQKGNSTDGAEGSNATDGAGSGSGPEATAGSMKLETPALGPRWKMVYSAAALRQLRAALQNMAEG